MRSRSIKLMVSGGEVLHAPSHAPRGHGGPSPVVEIIDIPVDVTDDEVRQTFSRCVIVPVTYAEKPVSWRKIAGAVKGQFIRLRPGRPPMGPEERRVRINVMLPPSALAVIDARVGPRRRSQEITRLIMESRGGEKEQGAASEPLTSAHVNGGPASGP